ncbi:hypothetical protein [Fulvimarina sp. MAC8]|uniref:hypothetical protein n=1 Tax=Fulvimarina sp. MAC8 TaxID=3162874 RepID=UPI0032EBE738
MSATAQDEGTVWDPFVGTRPYVREAAERPVVRFKIPDWVKRLFLYAMLLGLVIVLASFVFQNLVWIGVGLLFGGVGMSILLDSLGKPEAMRRWLYAEIAKRTGWAHRHVDLDKAGDGKGSANKPASLTEALKEAKRRKEGEPAPSVLEAYAEHPLLAGPYSTVPELLKPHLGQPLPIRLQALYWGETREAIPFWLGAEIMDTDLTFAASALRNDRFGNSNRTGRILAMLAAYQLDRDTGIRAKLLAENFTGDSWSDFKTESTAFNDAFDISVAPRPDSPLGEVEMRLQQALTPATQTALLDLKERSRIQVVIDGPVVFVAGYEVVSTSNPDALADHLTEVVETFAGLVTGFKRYVE